MALTAYHSITYNSGLFHNGVAAGVEMELLAPGDEADTIKSILITNTHATADVPVSLSIQDDPESGTTSTFYLLSTIAIPSDTALLLDNSSMLSFDNSGDGYGLYITVGSTDTLDVLISI